MGTYNPFPATNHIPKSGHGFDSAGFPTIFPLGFRLFPSYNVQTTGRWHSRWTTPSPPSSSTPAHCQFQSLFTVGCWHIIAFSCPHDTPPSTSDAIADFLPGLPIAYRRWLVAFRFALTTSTRMSPEATVYAYVRSGLVRSRTSCFAGSRSTACSCRVYQVGWGADGSDNCGCGSQPD